MFTYIFKTDKKYPIYRQLYEYIKEDITNGKIKPNEKLPSKRRLSEHLKISVITVEQAYEQLIAEGYIYSQPKKGYYATLLDGQISTGKAKIAAKIPDTTETFEFDFRTNSVNTECFPFSTWAKLLRTVLNDHSRQLLNKTSSKGLYELRVEIAAYLKEYRSINAVPEQIVIGAGSEYLMNILIQLLGQDKIYAVENPGYLKIPKILNANGINPKHIKMDNEGIKTDELEKSNADVVHITPSHHFPLGTVMPVKRRIEILQWADKNNGYIIEDDYDSEFRYSGKPIPALQSLDRNGRVIYLNTFTKNLAPALRISYIVLPPDLLSKYENSFTFYSNTVPSFEQYTLAAFMHGGHFERYINRMRKLYKERITEIENRIKTDVLGEKIKVYGQNSGLHILIEIKTDMSEKTFIKKSADHGIALTGITDFYKDKINYNNKDGYITIIAGYSGITKEKISKALDILAEIINNNRED
jgi:GntR family transcriptional regulator/MocR family aminotransferase